MKKILVMAFAAFAALSAAHAHAAKTEYVAVTVQGNSVGFSIADVRQIELTSDGSVKLTYENATNNYGYLTNAGNVFAKIKADNPQFLTHGANVLFVPSKARYVACQSGQTTFAWNSLGSESINDGCALEQQYRQKFTN